MRWPVTKTTVKKFNWRSVTPTIFQNKPIAVFGGGLFAWNLAKRPSRFSGVRPFEPSETVCRQQLTVLLFGRDKVKRLLTLHKAGVPARKIAEQLDISASAVYQNPDACKLPDRCGGVWDRQQSIDAGAVDSPNSLVLLVHSGESKADPDLPLDWSALWKWRVVGDLVRGDQPDFPKHIEVGDIVTRRRVVCRRKRGQEGSGSAVIGSVSMNSPEDDIAADVDRVGWSCLTIHDTFPPFAYTVGLMKTHDHPELILFGRPEDDYAILADLVAKIARGVRLDEPKEYDLLEGFPVATRPVDESHHESYLGFAMGYVRRMGRIGELQAVQVIVPDIDGVYPFQPNCASQCSNASRAWIFR